MVNSPMQENGKAYFKQTMLEKLAKKPWIADHRKPTVHCVYVSFRPQLQSSPNLESLVGD
jgi:hypothetical protein